VTERVIIPHRHVPRSRQRNELSRCRRQYALLKGNSLCVGHSLDVQCRHGPVLVSGMKCSSSSKGFQQPLRYRCFAFTVHQEKSRGMRRHKDSWSLRFPLYARTGTLSPCHTKSRRDSGDFDDRCWLHTDGHWRFECRGSLLLRTEYGSTGRTSSSRDSSMNRLVHTTHPMAAK
jgi:hypothetical protein